MKAKELQTLKAKFGVIGHSPGINYALKIAVQVAPTDLSILIVGESGVGKEVFSNIIHKLSRRKHEHFIAINCGALPEGTIDSELFGHEKGAFTDADKEREGYFEKVSGGTIFLDEIGEMPLGTQARLLRILETGEYIRVGSSTIQKANVRVVAATNKNLQQQVKQGKFREDLYYRLNTVPIRVPALHERKDDIPLLFRKFCADFSSKYQSKLIALNEQAEGLLKSHRWEGNVRQLKNVAEQLSVLEDSHLIDADTLRKYLPVRAELMSLSRDTETRPSEPIFQNERELLYKLFFDLKKDVTELRRAFLTSNPSGTIVKSMSDNSVPSTPLLNHVSSANVVSSNPTVSVVSTPRPTSDHAVEEEESTLNIAEKEKELIQLALRKHRGKKRNAALDLGISERTLYRKIKDYAIHV